MASILFDDITFPRELYDPDTLEFVAPVSTLLSFTPHILSQLAKTSEQEQVPMPMPSADKENPSSNGDKSAAADKNNDDKDKDKDKDKSTNKGKDANGESSSSSSKASGGLFSTFMNIASHSSAQRILEHGLYHTGRHFAGDRDRERDHRDPNGQRDRYSTRSNNDYRSWEGEREQEQSRHSWFGRQDNRDLERERLREMERRLQQMEQDMHHNSAVARSEVEEQRRERFRLEQELEAQKKKVKKLETEVEEQKDQEEKAKKEKKKKEDEEKKTKEAKEKAVKEKEKTSGKDKDAVKEEEEKAKALLKKSDNQDPAVLAMKAALVATVGVASLVMSLYAAHKASSTYSVVSFHDQLEELISQCHGVVQSTEAWMSEQFLEVPEQVRADVKMVKELIDTIQRLDPRSEKKAETVAWSMSAVGSLGAVGGAVLGSMTAMASGGTVVVGCALYGIVARARYNGPEYKGARSMMELKAAQVLRSLGVNPAAPISAATSTGGGVATRTSLIHDSRIERLRLEFEKRDGHDLMDADEVDGLMVEDRQRNSAFAGPSVFQKQSTMNARERRQSNSSGEVEDLRPTLKPKKELMREAVAYAS